MKSFTAFCLGAAIMYLLTVSDTRKPRRDPVAPRIEVDRIPDTSLSIAVHETPVDSNYQWLANRTRQWITDLEANLNKPYEPKGVFANVRKAH